MTPSFALRDEGTIRQSEDDFRALVNAGHGARAVAVVRPAALANG
ncbi:hypothetical protein [Porphyrobacter sp. YT40]|nr:hypothetical protein [Porphyrobacter sp. YT40]